MSEEVGPERRSLERFRSYLLILARMNLNGGPRNRIDPSDVVQQTLLEAHAKADQFHGDSAALAAWLRQALVNNLRDTRRALGRRKRDVRRERSLEEAVEQSSARLEGLLAAPHSTPMRDDVVKASLERDVVAKNAPSFDDGFFVVPKVIDS